MLSGIKNGWPNEWMENIQNNAKDQTLEKWSNVQKEKQNKWKTVLPTFLVYNKRCSFFCNPVLLYSCCFLDGLPPASFHCKKEWTTVPRMICVHFFSGRRIFRDTNSFGKLSPFCVLRFHLTSRRPLLVYFSIVHQGNKLLSLHRFNVRVLTSSFWQQTTTTTQKKKENHSSENDNFLPQIHGRCVQLIAFIWVARVLCVGGYSSHWTFSLADPPGPPQIDHGDARGVSVWNKRPLDWLNSLTKIIS